MRHFVKCKMCFSVAAVDSTLDDKQFSQELKGVECGICRGRFFYMGHVQGGDLVEEHEKSPCDERCTFALGPKCVCHCDGLNHGNGILVKIKKVRGKAPVITPKHVDHEVVTKNLKKITALRERLEKKDASYTRMQLISWNDPRWKGVRKALKIGSKMRSFAGRIKVYSNALKTA